MGDLEGSAVVIVGGSSGMGLATARMAAARGASVTIAGRDPDRLAKAQAELGGQVRTFKMDVSNEDDVAGLFQAVEHVDHVVSLAGTAVFGRISEIDTPKLRPPMEVRFWGSLYLCKYAPPKMPPGGSITLSSGIVVERPVPGRSMGAASTAATEAFGRAMALELAPVRVNTVRPGGVDTPLADRSFGDRKREIMAEQARRLPVGRYGVPDDIARAIIFLMEDGYVTGVTLTVDGGHLLL